MIITRKKLSRIIRETAERICLTPDAFYDIHISPREVGVNVRLPMPLNLSEQEAIMLENLIHDAMERILARYFI